MGTEEKILETLEKLNKKLDNRDSISTGGIDRNRSRSDNTIASDRKSSGKEVTPMYGDKIVKSTLADSIEDAINKYGGTFDYFTGKYENFVSFTVKAQSRLISEMANDAERLIGDRTIVGVFGSAAQARKELQEIYDVNSYYINRIAQDYAKETEKGTEMMLNTLTIQRALRIKNEDFLGIIDNQMASSGKVTEEVFKKIAFYAEAYSQQTAASIYQITNNITAAMADYEKYGAASEEAIAKFGGTLSQLQLTTQGVDSLVSKAQGFEGAAQLARDMGGAFGAALDPIALMNAAYEDQASFIDMIRNSMFEAGMDSETMGHSITLLAKTLNMSVNDTKKLFDSQVSIGGIIADSVSATGYSAENAEKVIADLQESIIDTRSVVDIALERGQSIYEVAIDKTFMKFKDLNQDVKEFIANDDTILKLFNNDNERIQKFAQLTGDIATKSGGERQKAIEAFKKEMDAIIGAEGATEATKKRAQELLATFDEVTNSENFNDIFKRINEPQRIQIEGVEVDKDQILTDLGFISQSEVFNQIGASWENSFAFTKRQSPSPLEIQTANSINALADEKDVKWSQNLNAKIQKAATVDVKVNFNPEEEKMLKGGRIDADLVIKAENQALVDAIGELTSIQKNILLELQKNKETPIQNNIVMSGELKLGNTAIAALDDIVLQGVDNRLTQRGVVGT